MQLLFFLFRHNLILIFFHSEVQIFSVTVRSYLYLKNAYPAWCEILLVIEDITFHFGSWRFSISIVQRLR